MVTETAGSLVIQHQAEKQAPQELRAQQDELIATLLMRVPKSD